MTTKSKEEVIEAIKSVSKSLGTEVLTQRQFYGNSDITISNVNRYFTSWSEACHAAGIERDRTRDRVPDEDLLTDWGKVTRDLGHIPSLNEYKVLGRYTRNTFDRFGKWVDVPDTFGKFYHDSGDWEDVLAIVAQYSSKPKVKKTIPEPKKNYQSSAGRWHRLDNRQVYGDPIDFRGLRHEPVNENGVVFLFGMVAHDLGYRVEAIQIGFPDCEAKRRIDRGQWQTVQIEFEYESKNFEDHRHDPKKCDVIVCWIHNWTECPDDIEVLALSDVIKTLR
jgi:hypothetical protein